MYTTSDIRKGLKIELDGKPFIIVDFLHVKPGKGGAFVRTKLKNMETGQVLEQTFRSGERIAVPDMEEKSMQYLYKGSEGYCFMDNETYEQVFLTEDQLGDNRNYLAENIDIEVLYFEGRPIGIELPVAVDLEVVQTEPGIKGDTASSVTKPAALETGMVIQVPLFINEGEKVRVDTRTGEYMERAK